MSKQCKCKGCYGKAANTPVTIDCRLCLAFSGSTCFKVLPCFDGDQFKPSYVVQLFQRSLE
jgi:hypothetical protein